MALPDNDPEKIVVESVAVLGLNDNFVEDVLIGKLPVFAVTHVGYTVIFEAESSTIVEVEAAVAVAAFPPILKLEAVPVNPVPAPVNEVDENIPVDGL